ncbi:MAG TPA: hypothetical protein VFA22_08315 [Stellaceae bacterium]|nr:hypothetical protein [Stellaceae bacterium]
MRELKFAGHEGRAVQLGGRSWVMADLAPRQFRKVIPAILALGELRSAGDLDEAKIERLIDALYWALTRNYPDLARDEFYDLPIKLSELIAALPALGHAAGLERAEGAAGEGQGAAATSRQALIH